MNTKEEVLKACTIHGEIIKLPSVQLDRKLYQEVAKALELIGGKWKGGKTAGFIFPHDPTGLLDQIANGEKRNLKKEFQFFETPPDLADWLVQKANIKPTDYICEPSAGQGAIVKAIYRHCPELKQKVATFELMPVNKAILKRIIPNIIDLGDDFLQYDKQGLFDCIIANPPFSKNQDIDHVQQMFRLLKPGGRLVSIMSQHWCLSENKKETEFRVWLYNANAIIHEIPSGTFKNSGTMISANIVVIHKPVIASAAKCHCEERSDEATCPSAEEQLTFSFY